VRLDLHPSHYHMISVLEDDGLFYDNISQIDFSKSIGVFDSLYLKLDSHYHLIFKIRFGVTMVHGIYPDQLKLDLENRDYNRNYSRSNNLQGYGSFPSH
jgi:hypothetical protein